MAEKKTNKKTKTVNRVKVDKPIVKKQEVEVVKKEEKVTFNLIEVIIIMIITAIFGILIGSTVTYFKNNVVKSRSYPDKFDEFLEVYDELMDNYYEDLDGDELISSGIKGMLDYLEDTYSEYLDEQATDELMQDLNGEFVGLGVRITVNDKDEIYIAEIFPNSPAEKANFAVGDVLLEVDGVSTDTYGFDGLADVIKGKSGTQCTIKVKRGERYDKRK